MQELSARKVDEGEFSSDSFTDFAHGVLAVRIVERDGTGRDGAGLAWLMGVLP